MLLKLKITNTNKTSTGKIIKLVNKEFLSKNENHIEEAEIINSEDYISQSDFYRIHTLPNEVKISTSKNVGFHNNSKLIIDKESNSLKIHLSNSTPDEIFFDQIENLEVSIQQNATGEKGDLVEGKIILNSAQFGSMTIFHCNVKEENQLDFTSDQLEKDLIALKAIIEFEIYNTIDQNLETLDLDSLKENQEKLKDILPNEDLLES